MNWYPARVGRLREWDKTKPLAGYCLMVGLWDIALDLGGLPNDPKVAAAITGFTAKQMEMCWQPFVDCCTVLENDRLMPTEIIEAERRMLKTSERLREAGRKGGRSRKFTPVSNDYNDLQEAKLADEDSPDSYRDFQGESNRINDLEEAELPIAVNGGTVVYADFGEKFSKSLQKVDQEFRPDLNGINDLQEAKTKQHVILEHDKNKSISKTKVKKEKDMSKIAEDSDLLTSQVSEIFSHWQTVLDRQKSKLDPKREKCIRARLKEGFTITELKTAINGCRASKFHMGDNDSRKAYTEITLIFRDAPHVEEFTTYLTAGKENVICTMCDDKKKTPRFGPGGDVIGEDPCPVCQWLNGSIGAKFVAMMSGNLPGLPITEEAKADTKQVGKWIDDSLKGSGEKNWNGEQWKAAGYSVTRFRQFMEASNYKLLPKPKPGTVGKLWPEFTGWVKTAPAQNGSSVAPKTFCGQCEKGWIMPADASQSARRCACNPQ